MSGGIIGRSVWRIAWGTAVIAVTVACTTTMSGRGMPEPGVVPPDPAAAAAPVEVIPAPPVSVGTVLEAHRLAAAAALVQTTFPDRTTFCFPRGPLVAAAAVASEYFADDAVEPILDRHGFVAAWGQCHRSAPGSSTITLVMELSDPGSATRAADELVVHRGEGRQPVVLPASGASALVDTATGTESVQAWVAAGRMLAYTFTEAASGQGIADADRVMTDQARLMAEFTPTPQDQVPSLPVDPHGLQGVTLRPPGELNTFSGPYDLEGYLRLAIDPFAEREVLAANGFTGMYAKHSGDGTLSYAVNLYAFPTSAQTNAAYTAFAQLETAAFAGQPFRLPSIPEAPCFVFAPPAGGGATYGQRCYVGYGSHLAGVDVSGLSAPDDTAAMDRLLPEQRDLIDG